MGHRSLRMLPALVLAALTLVSHHAASAQARTQDRSAVEALAGPLYRQLAALKGVASPGAPPPILIKSREETRRFIQQELDRRYSPERLESERKGMVAWGLIPPDYDLRRLFVDLMEEQIAAYYDPRGKVMVLGDWLPPEQQEAALAHELVHALQDRQMSLEAFITPRPGQGDQLLARQALVEGEAVALMLDLLLRAQGADLTSLPDLGPVRSLVTAGGVGPAIDAAPKFLRDLLIFPYVDGLNFVFWFRKAHPWSAMQTLYRDPPRSTAQILNPDKRLVRREDPIPITLPDLGPLAPGVKVVAEDELGEFALRAVLGSHLGDAAARVAAAGWRGDRYRIWVGADGGLVTAYLLATESPQAAHAFALAYAKVIEGRYPALSGKAAPGPTGALVTWRQGGRAFVVEERGARVLVLEQMPAGISGQVREAVWRSGTAKP